LSLDNRGPADTQTIAAWALLLNQHDAMLETAGISLDLCVGAGA
jgi:hypothetical protein